MYEHKSRNLLPWPLFLRRVARHIGLAGIIVAVVLGIGTSGYHLLAALPWIDAFLNASMILAGMGPVDPLPNTAAKLFAALYALFSGLVFITVMGVLLAPWIHRTMHAAHLDHRE